MVTIYFSIYLTELGTLSCLSRELRQRARTECQERYHQILILDSLLETRGGIRNHFSNNFELSRRFSADKLYVTASVKLGEKGTKIDVKDLDLSIKIQDIHIEMECLFPR